MKPNDRVRTADYLDHTGWPQSHSRRPGAVGTITNLLRRGSHAICRVEHDDKVEARYYASELTVLDPVESGDPEAAPGAPPPEPPPTTTERLDALSSVMVIELNDLADRVLALEQRTDKADRMRVEVTHRLAARISTLEQQLRRAPSRDALEEYQRSVMRALGYDGVEGPDPEQALADIAKAVGQNGRLRRRLREIAGHDGDEPLHATLTAIEERCERHRELLECIPAEQLGLLCDWLEQAGDDLGQKTLASLLAEVIPGDGDGS